MYDIPMSSLSNDELRHYGVKGMRWGVRKDDEFASEFEKKSPDEIIEMLQKGLIDADGMIAYVNLKMLKEDGSTPPDELFLAMQEAADYSKVHDSAYGSTKDVLSTVLERANEVDANYTKLARTKEGREQLRREANESLRNMSRRISVNKGKSADAKTRSTKRRDKWEAKNKAYLNDPIRKVKSKMTLDNLPYMPDSIKKKNKAYRGPFNPNAKIGTTYKKRPDGGKSIVLPSRNRNRDLQSTRGSTDARLRHSDSLDDFIAHYGVLGMKWGVRKDARRRVATGADDRRAARKKARSEARSQRKKAQSIERPTRREAKRASTKKSSSRPNPKKMSDAELMASVQRLRNEREYARLMSELNPPKTSIGSAIRKSMKDAVVSSASELGKAYLKQYLKVEVDKRIKPAYRIGDKKKDDTKKEASK